MKTGKSLVELAQELERQSQAKKDFIVSTETIEMTNDQHLLLDATAPNDNYTFSLTSNAHSQIAQRLNIPIKYYEKMRSLAPDLLATNVNTWFQTSPERRMIRTLDGQARAFLSDRYRRLDNYQLADVVLNVLSDLGEGIKIESCELTDKRMYIKAINQRLELEVKPGDPVQAGICVSNSEIGLGSLSVEPLIYRLVCTNGMIARDFSTKKYHVGRAAENQAFELFSDETIQADDKAFFLKVRDTVKSAVEIAKFSQIVQQLKEATQKPIEGNPVKTVEVLADDFHYSKDESSGILNHLIRGGDLTAYGLSNAITRTAQDLDDYDRSTDFERDGSRILALSSSSWKKLATAL
jgi:Domain of unknown function (DUF932)